MPGNEPTSDVPMSRSRHTLSAPTDLALTTSRTLRPTPSLHPAHQEPLSPARLRNVRSLSQDAFVVPLSRCRHPEPPSIADSTPRDRELHTRSSRPRLAPHQRVSGLPSRLDRASHAVPARLATALHDERTSSTRDACDRLLPPIPSESCTHRRSATGCQILTLAGGDGTHLLAEADSPVHGAFHDAPRASGSISQPQVAGRFFPCAVVRESL